MTLNLYDMAVKLTVPAKSRNDWDLKFVWKLANVETFKLEVCLH